VLVVFSLTIPADMYIPIAHNVAPTAIAVALLIRLRSTEKTGNSVMVAVRR
jgi:hypothetical protein